MGKKVKKEAEPFSRDVVRTFFSSRVIFQCFLEIFSTEVLFLQFDPLPIESKTAATAVLMLSSPEEEVLAKACEAIHKFAEKGNSLIYSYRLRSLRNLQR